MNSIAARHIRLALSPGLSLFDALVRPLSGECIHSASTTILGGAFSQMCYCVAPPDPSGAAVVAYGKPINAGAAYMIFGNATLGKRIDGAPLVHCHAVICTSGGDVKGGHILPDKCIIGPDPISVLVTTLDAFELRQAFDPETNIPILQPHEGSSYD